MEAVAEGSRFPSLQNLLLKKKKHFQKLCENLKVSLTCQLTGAGAVDAKVFQKAITSITACLVIASLSLCLCLSMNSCSLRVF